MKQETLYQRLRENIAATITINQEQMDLILKYFKWYEVKKNKIILSAGETNQWMNFVGYGCLRIFFIKDDGQEVTRYLAFEHMFATGLASFITQQPSFEYLQAMEDTQLLRISRTDFYYLLSIIPAWEKFFRDYLSDAYINNLEIFHRETTKDAEDRYRELLHKYPTVVQRLPNKIIASYLNMSPETLSRMKRKILNLSK
ncbi:Crp/Fnr family transcriptional regulator [Olivibacter ginsenosidimutans]|uniref:Crp/Fnr family transcriptional regulator n=1 Tax=Olivibacter ginsenosidimutans TaxID=1176537 RepID=A0ABP9CE51_9SPHI